MNRMPAFTCSLLIVLSSLLALVAAGEVRADAKADFELRVLQADQAAPRVVRAGEPFTLVFSGVWLDSCVPRLLGFEGEAHRRVLVLEARPITQACAAVLTPFEQRIEDLSFPADFAGIVEIALVAGGTEWLSTFDLTVQGSGQDAPAFSAFNVEGAWYSPRFSGSGLTLVHSRAGEADSLVGMWMNFDSAGAPRWYLLANSAWVTPTRVEGVVYRLTGQPYACTLQYPNPDCELAAVTREQVDEAGEFAIDFVDGAAARLQFSQLGADGQPVLATPIEIRSLR